MERLPIRSCIFFGAPAFAASVLSDLIQNQHRLQIEISGVVTPPAKPVGRKKVLTPCAVEETARKSEIAVWHSLDQLPDSFDLAIVYAYGQILPQSALNRAVHGFWNIHPSLLPAYRGAAPMVMPVALGDQNTGVTIIQMDAQLDHGPILAQEQYRLDPMKTRLDLESELSSRASGMIHELITRKQAHTELECQNQNHQTATFTRILTRTDGFLKPELIRAAVSGDKMTGDRMPPLIQEYLSRFQPDRLNKEPYYAATTVWNCFRALIGWPGIWTTVTIAGEPKRMKLIDLKPVLSDHSSVSDTHASSETEQADHPIIRVQITTAQLEGKQPTSFSTIADAYPEIATQLGGQ